MMDAAWALEAQGERVLSLMVGQPDFAAPPHVIAAAQQSLADGQTRYIGNAGLPSLREAVAADYAKLAPQRSHSPENIVVSHGSMFAFASAFMAVLEPGDEVLLPNPEWPNWSQAATLLHAKPVYYPCDPSNGWLPPPPSELAAYVTPRTKLLLVCTPNNPTGAVLSLPALQAYADFCAARGLFLLSDEIYSKITFDGDAAAAPSVLNTQHDADLTLCVSGVGKTYAMTGFRVGWLHAPPRVASLASKMHEPFLSCGVPFAQAGAEAALRGPQGCVREMAAAYQARRDAALEIVREFGLYEYTPEGAFYLLMSTGGEDSEAFAQRLLRERRVAVAPGAGFGSAARHHVRISLASAEGEIREGVRAVCEMAAANRRRG